MFSTISRALLLVLALTNGAGAEPIKLRYGQAYSAFESIYALPIFIADQEGFFARAGLIFSSILIPGGGERMIAALDDGTVDIAHVATAFLVHASLSGSDAVAIAAEFDNPIYSLVARPEIRRFADLKGRLVGLADEAGSVAYATRKLLERHGVAAGDIRVKVISGTPARVECLTRGDCDAVPLGQPQDFVAMAAGFRLLGRSDEAVPRFLYTVTAVKRDWAAGHGEALRRYVSALGEAFAFIRDPSREDEVVRIIVATTGGTADAARRTLALYLRPDRKVLPLRGEIDMAGLRRAIAFLGEAGIIRAPLPPAERFVDLRYQSRRME